MLPYVPSTPGLPEPVDNDRRDLLTAIRLLSGYECLRDPQQAHVMLVGLTDSHRPEVAEEARSILKTALTKDWFTSETPRYSELERMAERTIAGHRKGPQDLSKQVRALVIGGLVAVGIGLFVFLQPSPSGSGDAGIPWVMVAVLGLLVALGFVFALRLRNR